MYQVLIVEDEPIVRKGLKSMIHWADLGMSVIADAADGQDAWEKYNEHSPDILITDLLMPLLDGISLIKKIRETNKRIVIIILTCLDDFSMLQNALALGVSSYLLKITTEPVQIEQVLSNVKTELDSRSKDLFHDDYIDFSLIREQILDDFIFYRALPTEVFSEYVRYLNMRLDEKGLITAAINLPNYNKLIKILHDSHGRKLRSVILNIINKRLDHYDIGEVYVDQLSTYMIVFSFRNTDEDKARNFVISLLTEFKTDIRNVLEVDIQYGISFMADRYEKLPEQRSEALSDLDNWSKSVINPKVECVKKYINDHYAEDISLQSAADNAGISANYVSHLFAQYADATFSVYLNRIRVERAKHLLENSELLISEISKQVGFWNTSYFIRVFKRQTGYPPDEFRKRITQ
ncbi:MAG: response regulator [Bacillota bacterium]|nr:response regulator [Bacillota bacterium]